MTPERRDEPPPPSWRRPTLILAIGTFAQMFGISFASAALPGIIPELDVDVATASWILSGESLALSAGMLVGGVGSDRWGRRRIFCAGLIGYGLFSVLSAAAPSAASLTAARVAAGLASGPLLAGGLALLWETVDEAVRPRAVAVYAALTAVAAVAGPLAASLALRVSSWRAGFAFLAPLSLAGVVLVQRTFPADVRRAAPRVAWTRALLAGAAIGVLLYVLSAPARGEPARWILAPPLAVVLALLVRAERHAAVSLLPHAMRSGAFARALVASAASGAAFGASLFAMPLFVVEVWNRPPAWAAPVMAPAAITAVLGAITAGPVSERRGFDWAISASLWVACASMAALAALDSASPLPLVVAVAAAGGFAFGFGGPAMVGGTLRAAPEGDSGSASAWYNTVRSLGSAVGVAGFGTIHGLAGEPVHAFQLAFGAVAAFVAVLTVSRRWLAPSAG